MFSDFSSNIASALAGAADPRRAPAMRAYMRDQFDFLGVPTPQRRLAVRPQLALLKGSGADNLLRHAHQLWQLPQREYQYAALDLLSMHWKELNAEHLSQLFALAQSKSWWDSVDAMAGIIGDVLRHTHAEMDNALLHDNFWMRRIAMLHQLGWRGRTDTVRLFDYALALAHEKEFFIQKAIGWALRDYARHDPDGIRDFIGQYRSRLSPLSCREAGKHL